MDYTIEKINNNTINKEILIFIHSAAINVNERFGNKFPNWKTFPMERFLNTGHLWICYKNGEPVGFMAAQVNSSFFDPDVKILKQQLLYGVPGTKASYLLFKEFVDFGRLNANHVITMITPHTNIKPQTLVRKGFKLLETLYRLEF